MKSPFYLLAILISFASCDAYLEEMPDSSLSVDIDSEAKIAEMLTAAYPKASYFGFLEPRTDNAGERIGGVNRMLNEAMFFWKDYDQEDLDTPLNYWNDCYRGIAQANHVLEALKSFPEKTERIRSLYGEAFLIRAYLHFMLVNIWSKPYDPATADAEPGIPYLTKPERNAFPKYERGTVKQVYEAIENDLLLGLGLINDKYYKHPAYHFNKHAAYAFAARFFLYKGDWDKVIAYSNYVLGGNPASHMRNWMKYHETFFLSDDGISTVYTFPDEKANLLIASVESRVARHYIEEQYGLNEGLKEELLDKFGPVRKRFIYPYRRNKVFGTAIHIHKFKDFSNNEESGNNPRGIFMNNNLFTTEEVLLNRAEAYAMKKQYFNASVDISIFMQTAGRWKLTQRQLMNIFPEGQNRYTPFTPLSTYQGSMIQVVSELRRRAFIHEGLRWFDIRRFHLSVSRNKPGESFSPDKVLRKYDERKLIQIPPQAIKAGIGPNPR